MEKVIDVKNVTKTYKIYNNPKDRVKEALSIKRKKYHEDFNALNDITLNVNKGETIGIIGKNGSGKSTLLKLITGVLTPTKGEVNVKGRVAALIELGAGFNPDYTGLENIYLYGTLQGKTKEEMDKDLEDIISFADIGDFINQPIKTYSSGMFARLAFSTAVHVKPDILIVDEALAVGDIFFQQKCNLYMKEKMQGVTKLLVTHDMNSIANMADRAIVLAKGKCIFQGDPIKAIEYYTKSFHTEVFKTKPSEKVEKENKIKEIEINDWITVPKDSLGGAMEIKILGYQYEINNEKERNYVVAGDKILLKVLIESEKESREIILGYTVNDKYGNHIFGENTYSSSLDEIYVEKNKKYIVNLQIEWPEIQENEYFITMGIGEGTHEMQHKIQCWAHNIINLKNIALNSMHGIFNNKIEEMSFEEIV